ncbi:MAG: dTDP-glucose 4,6-dehydratase, partial [Pseudomonadota bacterium]
RQDWASFFGQYAAALGGRAPTRPLWALRLLATLLEAISRLTGRPPLASHDALAYILSRGWYPMEKAERVLGFVPPISAEEGMARTVAWLTRPPSAGR